MPITRPLRLEDAPALSAVLTANRAYVAPWQPLKPDRYFSVEGQRDTIAAQLEEQAVGTTVPLVIEDGGALAGAVTLQSVIRGAFQSCSVGYWLAEGATGRGLATAALREAVDLAFGDLRLHRVQAETVLHNRASQAVLARVGFVQYGRAPSYLKIAGEWVEHVLFQLVTPTPERVRVP